MRFNRTLTFETSDGRDHLNVTENSDNTKKLKSLQAVTLESEIEDSSGLGTSGVFNRIRTDFTLGCGYDESSNHIEDNYYKDEPHWPEQKRKQFRKVRFVICIIGLMGLGFAIMSRLMLNVSIVGMVRQDHGHNQSTDTDCSNYESFPEELYNITNDNDQSTIISPVTLAVPLLGQEEKLDWNQAQVNAIIGSIYIGVLPGVLVGGGIAESYGGKYPLLVCVFGSAIINLLTPTIARFSFGLMITSRISLGLIQGSMIPSLYELFNKWLTRTEASIFAPIIKVSIPMGSLIGTLLPGVMASYNIAWPMLFYSGGVLCCIWSAIWLYVATSLPQENRFVGQDELKRIMRKKQHTVVKTISHMNNEQKTGSPESAAKESIPWIRIISDPSVWALVLVKFTYSIGVDFVFLLMTNYLCHAFDARLEFVSAVYFCCFTAQIFLITLVGWLAKVVIARRTFGLSVTKWRKIFQGGSNFLMAAAYLVLASAEPNLTLSACCMFAVAFFWILGAGGESMVPYDLTSKYPASIAGLAYSFAALAGILLPAINNMIVGNDTRDPSKWANTFFLLAVLQAIGGLVFCLVVKSKPFLAEEKTQLGKLNDGLV